MTTLKRKKNVTHAESSTGEVPCFFFSNTKKKIKMRTTESVQNGKEKRNQQRGEEFVLGQGAERYN
jgi:hypothetical protein